MAKKKVEESKSMKKKSDTGRLFGTCTKFYTTIILLFSLACVACSYVLAFLGREQIAETLSENIVTVVIGVFVTYAIKSYKETKSEKELEFEKKLAFRDRDGNGIDDDLEEEIRKEKELEEEDDGYDYP